jgi:hypothetical protein
MLKENFLNALKKRKALKQPNFISQDLGKKVQVKSKISIRKKIIKIKAEISETE